MAIRDDDWRAVESIRADHPQFSFCNAALLRLAAEAGANGVASRLLRQGADPFAPDAAGGAFHAALRRGDGAMAGRMLAARRLREPAFVPDLRACLGAALDNEDQAAIPLLLQLSVQQQSLMPFELLARAIAADNLRRIALLVAQPAMALALQSTAAERMVVHLAIRHGSVAGLRLLLRRTHGEERASRLCASGDRAGNTALHYAVAGGDLGKLRLILDFDPGLATGTVGIHARNRNGVTPLELALQAGRADIAALLREAGGQARGCGTAAPQPS